NCDALRRSTKRRSSSASSKTRRSSKRRPLMITRMFVSTRTVRLLCAALLVFGFVTTTSRPAFADATILIVPNDGPGEGFNDPTPAAPVGGNTGTTKGAQRLIVFQRAAAIWGATLDSAVTIIVRAAFDPLGPGILGSAGPSFVFSDFPGQNAFHPGAEFPAT